MLYIVADISALVCIWRYDSMCIRDKGTQLCARAEGRLKIFGSLPVLCPVVWLLEKWGSGSPPTPPPSVLLGMSKAPGGPALAGTGISTPRKGRELFWDRWEHRGDSSSVQCFVLSLVWSMSISEYFFYKVIQKNVLFFLFFSPPSFVGTESSTFCPVRFPVVHSVPRSLYFMHIQNYIIEVNQPVPYLYWRQCNHTTGTAGLYFFLSFFSFSNNLYFKQFQYNFKTRWHVQWLSLYVLTVEKGLYEYIIFVSWIPILITLFLWNQFCVCRT